MPDVNLSKLSGSELRRLLDATRARGNATLAYQILQEMAARREVRGIRAFAAKRPAEPRVIALDLGDPLEPEAEPPPEPELSAAPPAQPAPVAGSAPRRAGGAKTQPSPAAAAPKSKPKSAPPSSVEPTPAPAPRPRSVWDDDPLPEEEVESKDRGLRLHPPNLEPARAALARRRVPGAGFAVGIVVGVGVGWWMADRREPPPAVPAAPAAALQIAAPEPQPMPAAAPVAAEPEPAPTPETPAAPPVEPVPDLGADIPSPDATEVATEPTEAPTAPADACAAEPTPADRKICGDPELQRLQRELRQAYAEALEAHADRALLRQRQLAWADARNTVTDPGRLAQLYEERIRKLNAAAAAAREQR